MTVILSLINEFNGRFSLKDLGPLNYSLGIKVSYPPSGSLFLSQGKYIKDLLRRTRMTKANSIPTPMVVVLYFLFIKVKSLLMFIFIGV